MSRCVCSQALSHPLSVDAQACRVGVHLPVLTVLPTLHVPKETIVYRDRVVEVIVEKAVPYEVIKYIEVTEPRMIICSQRESQSCCAC